MEWVMWASLWLNCSLLAYNIFKHTFTVLEGGSWSPTDFFGCFICSLAGGPLVLIAYCFYYIGVVTKKLYHEN